MKFGKRDHDNLYIKENLDEPKFIHKFFIKLLLKKKYIDFLDIGFGDGSLLKLLKYQYQEKKIWGCDINPKLINKAKKFNNIKIFKEDILNPKQKSKFDIVHASGVLHIFDDPHKLIKNIVNKCKTNGTVFICTFLSEEKIDVITRYKVVNNFNYKKVPEQMGWNKFSKNTIINILKNIKKIKKFKLHEIKFPGNLIVKKKKDVLRSWTVKKRKRNIFKNSIFEQEYFYIEINL